MVCCIVSALAKVGPKPISSTNTLRRPSSSLSVEKLSACKHLAEDWIPEQDNQPSVAIARTRFCYAFNRKAVYEVVRFRRCGTEVFRLLDYYAA
jgi:hypothetical protein